MLVPSISFPVPSALVFAIEPNARRVRKGDLGFNATSLKRERVVGVTSAMIKFYHAALA